MNNSYFFTIIIAISLYAYIRDIFVNVDNKVVKDNVTSTTPIQNKHIQNKGDNDDSILKSGPNHVYSKIRPQDVQISIKYCIS